MVSPGRLPRASFVRNMLNGIVGSLCVFQLLLSVAVFAQTPAPLSSPGTAAVVNGVIEIDGVKFFPFGFFHVSQGGTAAQLWNDLNLTADAGFNIIHSRYEPGVTDATYGAFLVQPPNGAGPWSRGPRSLLSPNTTTSNTQTRIL